MTPSSGLRRALRTGAGRDVVVVLAWFVVDTAIISISDRTQPVDVLVWSAVFVPLLWRRRAPTLIFVVVWVLFLFSWVLTPHTQPTMPLLIAVYTLAAECKLWHSLAGLVVGYVTYTPLMVRVELADSRPADPVLAMVSLTLLSAGFYALAWGIGRWVRFSRRRLDTLELRRQRAAAEAVASERSRIARELHDIVSHSVSVMVLQAAGAKKVLGRDPDRAAEALSQIETVGKQAMTELRRLLGLLRDGAFVVDAVGEGLGPQPGLAQVERLIRSFEVGGLTVRTTVQGRPRDLDDSVDRSAYRIVQEALANVTKHVGPQAVATVRQVWTQELLMLEITDDGGGASTDPGLSLGYGLLGLQERARAVGGRLEAGPASSGGFRVSASLPISQGTPGMARSTAADAGAATGGRGTPAVAGADGPDTA